MLKPTLVTLPETKLVGKKRSMSLIDNQTQVLWQDFMPNRKGITNRIGNYYYSVQNYNPDYFEHFNPSKTFEKWAAVAVNAFEKIPEDMESFTLSTGLYAVFEHKGMDTAIFQQIFTEWLPNAPYIWIIDLILNYWAKNTKMETLTRKNKYGFRFANND